MMANGTPPHFLKIALDTPAFVRFTFVLAHKCFYIDNY